MYPEAAVELEKESAEIKNITMCIKRYGNLHDYDVNFTFLYTFENIPIWNHVSKNSYTPDTIVCL